MKRLERNAAVLGQTVFLAEYLCRPPDLFRRDTGLQFDGLVTFDTEFGFDDNTWLTREEDQGEAIRAGSDADLLFAP